MTKCKNKYVQRVRKKEQKICKYRITTSNKLGNCFHSNEIKDFIFIRV